MNIRYDRAPDRIVVEQPRHIVGWAFVAAAILFVPAGFWATTIATSGGTAIIVGTLLLSGCFLVFAAAVLSAVVATFDAGSRTLTVRRDRPWSSAVERIPFAGIHGIATSKFRWLDGDEYRFEIVLASGRRIRMRYRQDDEAIVRRAAGEIDQFIRG